jgi:fibronectin-binding autotransporter adhesin
VATGTITDSAAAASTLTVNNTANSTFTGTITDNGANNSNSALSLTFNGPGGVTLSGSNSFNGLTTVNGGTLVVSNNYGLGNSASANGGLALTSGTVKFTSASPNVASLNDGVATGAGTSIILGNATAGTATTLIIGNGGALITDGLNMQYGGTISDLSATNAGAVGNLTVAGGSFLLLSGANTFTGITTMTGNLSEIQIANNLALQDSVLNFNGAGTSFSFGSLSAATFAGLEGSQNLSLVNGTAGPVTLTLGNNNGSSVYTGDLVGAGSLTKTGTGTVQIGSGAAGGAAYAGTTTVNEGTLIIGGTTSSATTFNLTGSGGANALTIQDSAVINSSGEFFIQSEGGNNFPGSSTIMVTGNASVTVPNLSFGENSRVTNSTLTIQGNASLIDNGYFDFDYNFGGSTNGTPTTFLDGGVLAVQKFQMTAVAGGIANPAIHFNGGVLEALASDPVGGTFLPAIGGLTADVDSGLNVNTNGFNITIAQALIHGAGTPDGGLSVTDTTATPGSLTLTGTDTYTGSTTINSGATLQLGNGTAGNDGTILDTLGITDNGTLIYNRGGSLSSGVTIVGDGIVKKIGPGTQTLTATNTYTGATTVSGGTLIVSGALSGSSLVSVSNGATLQLAASNALDSAGQITLAGGTLQNLAGETQAVGSLTLGAGSSNLTLGTTSSIVDFADSRGNTWVGTLTINDWSGSPSGGGTDEIFIGASADLTTAQLADITFVNGTVNGLSFGTSSAIQLSDGEIVAAVPEPGTWASLIGGAGMLLLWRRSRRRKL